MTTSDYYTLNRLSWDERVPVHLDSDFYGLREFLAGADAIRDFERAEVGEVSGKDLLHLQCHFGLDTLSWARHGARVTGLDFSEKAIEAARSIAAQVDLPARFVTADVYAAEQVLGETYDVVYTGIGALCWLPDIDRWAATVAALLRPGGFLYLAEFHPFADILDVAGREIAHDYFYRGPFEADDAEAGTYADPEATFQHNHTVEFQHGIGEVVTALITAGLRLDFLHEREFSLWQRFSVLERSGGAYYYPAGQPGAPLLYSIRATKP
ncbi:methyltransferase family protein [Tamaricihabitans halophyticus]|uniref:Methyltransferase family protein n=1 Tax=Tamaricihabitans halophyticus TaxID=1262583 RepID=A0A4R2PZL3_9PSEU|nr:methyltransferase [Tamaricihabitans halophyticus]TCP41630.1 methyltransferase family protein [Tamaricihabitans halophyticus]